MESEGVEYKIIISKCQDDNCFPHHYPPKKIIYIVKPTFRWYITGKKIMKKNIFFVATLLLGALILSSFTLNEIKSGCNPTQSVTVIDSQSNIVFRGKQEFKNYQTGVEIHCYPSGKCEWWDGDRRALTCTYTVDGNEIKFLDEEGDPVYKGSIYWNNSHSKPLSITIQGGTYRNKN